MPATEYPAPEKAELERLLADYPGLLSEIERSVLLSSYGLLGTRKITPPAIAKVWVTTEQEVLKIKERAARKLYMCGYRDLLRQPPMPKSGQISQL